MGAEDIEYMSDYKEFPTKESALDWLDNYLSLDERNNLIRALQEPVLEKIKAEIQDLDLGFFDEDYRAGIARGIMEFNKILNKHISELKGENE